MDPAIHILGDIGDFVEVLIFLAFVIVSSIITAIKNRNGQKQQEAKSRVKSGQQDGERRDVPPPVRPSSAQQRRNRPLPYAKPTPVVPNEPRPMPYIKRLEELKRQADQAAYRKTEPSVVPPVPAAHLTRPVQRPPRQTQIQHRPVKIDRSSIQKRSFEKTERPKAAVMKESPKIMKPAAIKELQDLRTLLKNRKNLRKAIVLNEILGPPVSLK